MVAMRKSYAFLDSADAHDALCAIYLRGRAAAESMPMSLSRQHDLPLPPPQRYACTPSREQGFAEKILSLVTFDTGRDMSDK